MFCQRHAAIAAACAERFGDEAMWHNLIQAIVTASPASRDMTFDTNFLTPALLPPLTPMFRDLNTTGFTQVIN